MHEYVGIRWNSWEYGQYKGICWNMKEYEEYVEYIGICTSLQEYIGIAKNMQEYVGRKNWAKSHVPPDQAGNEMRLLRNSSPLDVPTNVPI